MKALQAGDPSRIGPYSIVGVLGAGGMGQVYLGRSPGGRSVAVKVIRPELAEDSGFRRRFAREVMAARAVSGAFTAAVVDADVDAPSPWLATVYVPGLSLTDTVMRHGPLPETSVAVLGAGLLEALEAIHAAGLVHRDLKPSNILLAADGPQVIDFGIAVAAEATAITRTGVVVGTPGFMAPEQLLGAPVGPATDVFAFGAVLVFAVTGRGAFGDGSAQGLMYRVVHEPAQLELVPDPLRELIGRCLAKDPAARPRVADLLAGMSGRAATVVDANWLPTTVTVELLLSVQRILTAEAPTQPQSQSSPASVPRPSLRSDLSPSQTELERCRHTVQAAEARAAECARVQGAEHPETLEARRRFAEALLDSAGTSAASDFERDVETYGRGFAEDEDRALTDLRSLITDCGDILGDDHPLTFAARHSLGRALGLVGFRHEMLETFESLERDLGTLRQPEHPDVLALRRERAGYMAASSWIREEGIAEFRSLIADMRRTVGPSHPDTLDARRGLALAHVWAGWDHRAEAVEEYRSLVQSATENLGPEDPRTLDLRREHAHALIVNQFYPEAHEQIRSLVDWEIRLLGRDHPDTLRGRLMLGLILARSVGSSIDKMEAAERELRRVVRDSVRVLGADHTAVLEARHVAQECFATREGLESLAADRVRVLGRDHIDTLRTQRELGWLYDREALWRESANLRRSYAGALRRRLGPEANGGELAYAERCIEEAESRLNSKRSGE